MFRTLTPRRRWATLVVLALFLLFWLALRLTCDPQYQTNKLFHG